MAAVGLCPFMDMAGSGCELRVDHLGPHRFVSDELPALRAENLFLRLQIEGLLVQLSDFGAAK